MDNVLGITLLFGAGLIALLLSFVFTGTLDLLEPPEVKSTIPFIGHALGIVWHQGAYFEQLSRANPYPIFTIRILTIRIYIIASASLVHTTFARPNDFSVTPYMAEASRRILNFDKQTIKIATESAQSPSRQPYVIKAHDILYKDLGPGSGLLQMTIRVLSVVAKAFNEMALERQPLPLYDWIKNTLTTGSAAALYGPKNPFSEDLSLIDTFWDVEADLILLLVRVFPSITARKGFLARDKLYKAFESYIANGLWHNGSDLIRERIELAREDGFTDSQIVSCEVPVLFEMLTNTVPTAWWILSHILVDKNILADIRVEIEGIMRQSSTGKMEMDITKIKSHCPLLLAVWHETLRIITTATPARAVMKDTLLNEEYFLKSGSAVIMPGAVNHISPSVWGPDAGSFNPRRFLPTSLVKEEKEKLKLQSYAYFPFGGGKNLCPGRHFAFAELMGLVAMFLYTVDVENADEEFDPIRAAFKRLNEGVVKPDGDAKLFVKRREKLKGVDVGFLVGGGEGS